MHGFESRHIDFAVCTAFHLGRIGRFQKEFNGLLQIVGRLFDRAPLAGDIKLGAEGDIAVPFLLDNRGELGSCHMPRLYPCLAAEPMIPERKLGHTQLRLH